MQPGNIVVRYLHLSGSRRPAARDHFRQRLAHRGILALDRDHRAGRYLQLDLVEQHDPGRIGDGDAIEPQRTVETRYLAWPALRQRRREHSRRIELGDDVLVARGGFLRAVPIQQQFAPRIGDVARRRDRRDQAPALSWPMMTR